MPAGYLLQISSRAPVRIRGAAPDPVEFEPPARGWSSFVTTEVIWDTFVQAQARRNRKTRISSLFGATLQCVYTGMTVYLPEGGAAALDALDDFIDGALGGRNPLMSVRDNPYFMPGASGKAPDPWLKVYVSLEAYPGPASDLTPARFVDVARYVEIHEVCMPVSSGMDWGIELDMADGQSVRVPVSVACTTNSLQQHMRPGEDLLAEEDSGAEDHGETEG